MERAHQGVTRLADGEILRPHLQPRSAHMPAVAVGLPRRLGPCDEEPAQGKLQSCIEGEVTLRCVGACAAAQQLFDERRLHRPREVEPLPLLAVQRQ